MARNRLTWQNVNAPDYGSTMTGMAAANRMFQDALGGLSTSLGDFATNRKNAQDEALLKLQQEAQGDVYRQYLAVSDDPEAQVALRKDLATRPNLSNDFMKDLLTDFRISMNTGNKGEEDLRQTIFNNRITQRDQIARDVVAPLQAEILRQEQLGNKEAVAQLQDQYITVIAGMNQEDQRKFFEGNMGQRKDADGLVTAELGRKQTNQNMYQSGIRFKDEQTKLNDSRMADAAVVYALGLSPDPIVQRRGIIDFTTQNGGSPAAALAAFDRHIKASQNVTSGGGAVGSGSGAGQSGGTTAPTNTDTGTILGNNPITEAERLAQELRTRAAQNQSLVSDDMIDAGERSSSVASLYEKAVKDFPETIGKLSSTEYNKLFRDIKNEHNTLSNDQIALAIEERFQMGPSNWESYPFLTNTPVTYIPSFIYGALFPDWGREAGVDKEGLGRTAEAVGTAEARNLTVTQRQALANAEKVLQEQVQRLTQAEQRKQQAEIHYQEWGNPAVLSDAEIDLQLEKDNLESLLNNYRTDEKMSEILLPLYRDPENPGKSISVQEQRKRTRAAAEANEVTARNRNEALAAIAIIETQIERLQDEHRSLPVDSPRAPELAFELDRLRRSLREAKKLAR